MIYYFIIIIIIIAILLHPLIIASNIVIVITIVVIVILISNSFISHLHNIVQVGLRINKSRMQICIWGVFQLELFLSDLRCYKAARKNKISWNKEYWPNNPYIHIYYPLNISHTLTHTFTHTHSPSHTRTRQGKTKFTDTPHAHTPPSRHGIILRFGTGGALSEKTAITSYIHCANTRTIMCKIRNRQLYQMQ